MEKFDLDAFIESIKGDGVPEVFRKTQKEIRRAEESLTTKYDSVREYYDIIVDFSFFLHNGSPGMTTGKKGLKHFEDIIIYLVGIGHLKPTVLEYMH